VGSKPKKSGSGSGAIGTSAQQNYSYGGQNMTQDAANQKYQADLAAWRAPTTTGTGTYGMDAGNIVNEASAAVEGGNGVAPTHLGVPTTTINYGMGSGGPAIPTVGGLPTAPTRTTLAKTMTPAASSAYYNNQGNGGTAGGRAASAGYSSSSGRARGTGLH